MIKIKWAGMSLTLYYTSRAIHTPFRGGKGKIRTTLFYPECKIARVSIETSSLDLHFKFDPIKHNLGSVKIGGFSKKWHPRCNNRLILHVSFYEWLKQTLTNLRSFSLNKLKIWIWHDSRTRNLNLESDFRRPNYKCL